MHKTAITSVSLLKESFTVTAGGGFVGTQCNRQKLLFEAHGRREVSAAFDGGRITSDAGGLLLREVEERFGILRSFGEAFTDYRSPDAIEFTVEELLRQRVRGIALGYEDLNDHEQLRHDPLLALMAGRSDITGQDRLDERSTGVPLAGKSTLNRLELTPAGAGEHSRTGRSLPAWRSCRRHLLTLSFACTANRAHRRNWCWIWTPPTIPCMEISWGNSSTVTTRVTVIFRCTRSATRGRWEPCCVLPTSMAARERCRDWNASCRN